MTPRGVMNPFSGGDRQLSVAILKKLGDGTIWKLQNFQLPSWKLDCCLRIWGGREWKSLISWLWSFFFGAGFVMCLLRYKWCSREWEASATSPTTTRKVHTTSWDPFLLVHACNTFLLLCGGTFTSCPPEHHLNPLLTGPCQVLMTVVKPKTGEKKVWTGPLWPGLSHCWKDLTSLWNIECDWL